MADNDCIIVHEQVVVPEPVVVGETVALPGEKESVDGKYFQDNIFIPFYKCSFTNGHLDTEFAIPINGDLEDLFVISFYNIASSWIKRVNKGNTIWEIKQNIYIGREYRHTINNDVLFYEGYAFVRGRITGLAKIDLNDGSLEFNKEVITEYENISLYNNYIVATGEKKILIIEPINFSVYKQIDIDSSTYSITSYNDRVLISAGKKLYIIKDIDSEIHTIEGESITSSFYIKYLINNDIDCYLLYDKGGTRLVAEDNSFDVKSSDECFNTVGFNPLYSLNYKNYAGNAIIFIICNIGYLTLKGFIGSISLLCKNNDCPTYSKLEEISKYFLEDGYVRRIGDIMYKVKIGYDTN